MERRWKLHERFLRIVDLLGGERSFVEREAAVYALSTLADDCVKLHADDLDEAQRLQQACLNLICTQLRDPISGEEPGPELLMFKHRVQELIIDRFRPSHLGGIADWSHLRLDLTYCHLHDLPFSLAVFSTPVNFSHARFHGDTSFNQSEFHAPVLFASTHFSGTTSFQRTRFHHQTRFTDAEFHGLVIFNEARFDRDIYFNGASFTDSAWFRAVAFEADVDFTASGFWGAAHFQDSEFASYTTFSKTQFTSITRFEKCIFRDAVDLCDVFFGGEASFNNSEFIDSVSFDDSFFTTSPLFRSALFNDVQFQRTHFHCPVLFGPYQFSADTDFSGVWFCSAFGLHEDQGSQMHLTFDGAHFGYDDDTVYKELHHTIPGTLLKTATFSAQCDSPLGIQGYR